MNRNRFTLKNSIASTLLGAAFCAPAYAGTIDFEDQLLTGLDGNQSIESGGFRLTAGDSPLAQFYGFTGAAGAVYRGASGCGDTPCPAGNSSKFYAGLNDGSVTITSLDGPDFMFTGLDFGFLAPTPGLPDGIWGQLRLTGYLIGGGTIEAAMNFAGQNAGGDFMFKGWNMEYAFARTQLGSLNISACMYDDTGACVNSVDFPAMNLAQFAIDNLRVNDVPEPAAPALLMLGALGMALSARRRAK